MKFKINDFRVGINSKLESNVVGFSKGKMIFNMDYLGGALKADLPFSHYLFTNKTNLEMISLYTATVKTPRTRKVFYFKKTNKTTGLIEDKLVLFNNSNTACYIDYCSETNASKFIPLDVTIVGDPVCTNYTLNGEDVLIISGKNSNMYIWDGVNSPVLVEDAPKITSMCVHGERLFISTGDQYNRVWFSDDLDPTNWKVSLFDAGFIDMQDERGKPLKVISFGGYVYIFREYGISKLLANGLQEDFYLTHLFVSGGKILPETIEVAGDRIIFMATDGIYEFDGVSTRRILDEVFSSIKVDTLATSAYVNGKYYLACNINYSDSIFISGNDFNNSLLVIDPSSKDYLIYRGLDVFGMCMFCEKGESKLMLASNADETLLLVSSNSNKISSYACYYSPIYDFGEPTKRKTVRRVSAYVENDKTSAICLVNERDQEGMDIILNKGLNDIPVVYSGEKIGFQVKAVTGCVISDIILDVFI